VIVRAEGVFALTLAATATVVVGERSGGAPTAHALSPGPATSVPVTAYAEGAPPGFSGGFGEQSCHACHFHNDVNSGPERVAIGGVPEQFVAGERYPLTVTLSRAGTVLAGFQLAARFKDDGTQAGTLAPAPGEGERVMVESRGGIEYANQRKAGTALAAAHTARWSLVWTAPDTRRPVVFHVAANAGDGDGTAEGDFVETATAETMPAKARPPHSDATSAPPTGR
jgi:hypothetical protein